MAAATFLCAFGCAGPELRVAPVFGDGMVLQQGRPVPVWGWDRPGRRVTVRFGGQAKSAVAGLDGRWMVRLDPMEATTGAGGRPMVVSGSDSATLDDVLVGEVWLCAGQSNMEWPLAKSEGGEQAAAAADHPAIRFFRVKKRSAPEPAEACEGEWQRCTPETAGRLSGVAYYFARDLQESLGVPIGLVDNSWSGAAVESLLPIEVFENDPRFSHRLEEWAAYRRDYPALLEAYERDRAAWEARKEAGADGPAPVRRPKRPKDPDGPETSLSGLYNGMVHPLVPLAIRGAIWYQGENNVLNPGEYRDLFPMLIRSWRRLWDQGDFPFLYVQIANFGAADGFSNLLWPELREAQAEGLREPNTAMVVAIDLGEARALHPKNKRDVGLRLARAAKALVYGRREVTYRGPTVEEVTFNGPRATVRFAHTDGGLVARGGMPVRGFAVAGEDRKFVPAEATIDGDTVFVSSPEVPEPVAVRYAWSDNPTCNLYNGAGLPAAPYRTDRWPRERPGESAEP